MIIDEKFPGLKQIENGDYVYGGNLESEETIEIKLNDRFVIHGFIKSLKSIIVTCGIKAGDGIEAGWGIEAGDGIKAGDGIEAKTFIHCEKRIFAGISIYNTEENCNKDIICAELRKGIICYGNLIIRKDKKRIMASLYEIDQSILDCIDPETGEIIDFEALEALQIQRDEKIEKVALWYKNLCSDAEAYKKEKDIFTEKQRAAENKAESLKKWIDNACGGNAFKTTKVDIKYRKSETVNIEDENTFVDWAMKTEHDDLLKYAAPTPNKTAIKRAIESGVAVKGATIQKKNNINIK